MSDNCYGICFNSRTINSFVQHWKYFENIPNSFKIIHNNGGDSTNDPIPFFLYTEEDIRKNFNFNEQVSKNHYWNSYGNRNLIWFYAYLRMINFYISHPNHDHYWFFDDDITMDNWELFFKGFENDDSDFLSYFLFKNSNVNSNDNVEKLDSRSHSGVGWFRRFPGHKDTLQGSITDHYGSFFAIVRYSNRALKELVKLTENNYYGYGEGFVPTSFAHAGFKMNSIFQSDNTSKYFDDSVVNVKHKHSKITWEWL